MNRHVGKVVGTKWTGVVGVKLSSVDVVGFPLEWFPEYLEASLYYTPKSSQ